MFSPGDRHTQKDKSIAEWIHIAFYFSFNYIKVMGGIFIVVLQDGRGMKNITENSFFPGDPSGFYYSPVNNCGTYIRESACALVFLFS